MPIIVACSLPSIALEHEILGRMRDQKPTLLEAARNVFGLIASSSHQSYFFGMLNLFSGCMAAVLAIVFLEGFWQHYRILRIKVYSVGMVASWINSIALTLTITPMHVLLAYWLS